MQIIILGTDLSALVCGHSLMDSEPQTNLHLLTDNAEVGLMDEGPGILTNPLQTLIPKDWIHDLRNQEPSPDSTAVRRSWLERAMASKLAERGAVFHLHTKHVQEQKNGIQILHLDGAGFSAGTTIEADHILESKSHNSSQVWNGGVHLGEPNGKPFEGCRPDGTVEIWWRKEEDEPLGQGSWLQEMEWVGEDPRRALETAIRAGKALATSIR